MEARVSPRWRKSSYSDGGNGQCVEAADLHESVAVRDSKLGEESAVLSFSLDAWRRFTHGIKLS
jgi:hypothetical protein